MPAGDRRALAGARPAAPCLRVSSEAHRRRSSPSSRPALVRAWRRLVEARARPGCGTVVSAAPADTVTSTRAALLDLGRRLRALVDDAALGDRVARPRGLGAEREVLRPAARRVASATVRPVTSGTRTSAPPPAKTASRDQTPRARRRRPPRGRAGRSRARRPPLRLVARSSAGRRDGGGARQHGGAAASAGWRPSADGRRRPVRPAERGGDVGAHLVGGLVAVARGPWPAPSARSRRRCGGTSGSICDGGTGSSRTCW